MPPPEHDRRPSALLWLAGTVSLVLPVVGVAATLYGIYATGQGGVAGWYWLGAGVALIVIDVVLDRMWARARIARSDEPALNRRGAELVGQSVVVIEPIEAGGRGKVRAGDTVWAAEGCAAAAGARVRVAGVKGTVLIVEAL